MYCGSHGEYVLILISDPVSHSNLKLPAISSHASMSVL